MDIRNRKELKTFAAQRLENAPQEKQIILIYSGLILGMSLFVTIINHLLGEGISRTGGLSNMGTRTVLSSFQTLLPIVQSAVVMCLDLGYAAAMLRIARGQHVSHRTLKLGFDRFWPLMRLTLIKGLIFFALGFACMYAGVLLYLLTPLSDSAMAIMEPLVRGGMTDPMQLMDSGVYGELITAMLPCFIICGLLYAVAAIPMWYQYRMAGYVLIDRPSWGAMMALRQSKWLMRGKKMQLFKLDLSMWLYYLLGFAAGFVAYGDVLLPMAGVSFPWSDMVSYYLFFVAYLLVQLAIYYFMSNRVSTAYALAYDAICPKETPENGVVLGNIFQM